MESCNMQLFFFLTDFFPQSIILWRFIQVVLQSNSLFYCFMVWIYFCFFNHSSAEGLLGCFLFGAFTNKAAIKICVQVFANMPFFSVEKKKMYPEYNMVVARLNFLKKTPSFCRVVVRFYIQSSHERDPVSLNSRQHLILSLFFIFVIPIAVK